MTYQTYDQAYALNNLWSEVVIVMKMELRKRIIQEDNITHKSTVAVVGYTLAAVFVVTVFMLCVAFTVILSLCLYCKRRNKRLIGEKSFKTGRRLLHKDIKSGC